MVENTTMTGTQCRRWLHNVSVYVHMHVSKYAFTIQRDHVSIKEVTPENNPPTHSPGLSIKCSSETAHSKLIYFKIGWFSFEVVALVLTYATILQGYCNQLYTLEMIILA